MAELKDTAARHVVAPARPAQDEAGVPELIGALRDDGVFDTFNGADIPSAAIAGGALVLVLAIIAAVWFGHGRAMGTRRAFEGFRKTGRPARIARREREPIDFRALRKSRPIIRPDDPSLQIYVPPPSPCSTARPSAPDRTLPGSGRP